MRQGFDKGSPRSARTVRCAGGARLAAGSEAEATDEGGRPGRCWKPWRVRSTLGRQLGRSGGMQARSGLARGAAEQYGSADAIDERLRIARTHCPLSSAKEFSYERERARRMTRVRKMNTSR